MPKDLRLKIQRAVSGGPDMRKPQYPGGYEPPAAGLARARLVGYFELGTHEEEFENRKRDREKVDLVFELSGPNHAPRQLENGTLVPIRIAVQETLSLDERSNFFRLFGALNYAGKATHMAELLGDPFIVEVFHRPSVDGTKIYATLKGPAGYMVTGPDIHDARTGRDIHVEVAQPITDLRMFVWASADKEDWYSIHIPGEYEEKKDAEGKVISPARSKNVIQECIMSAKNWPDHPLAAVVQLGGDPDAPSPEELERQREEELKEWQDENWRRLKAAVDNAVGKRPKEPPKRRARVPKRPEN